MTAIFKRELKAYFTSPIGYVFLSVMLLLEGLFFFIVLGTGTTDALSYIYAGVFQYGMFLIPVITMRSMSEEKKQKTDQALLTSPISVSGLVFGKFLGAFSLYAISIFSTLIHIIVLSIIGSPNLALVFGNILGSLLFGAALIAIGIFISSLTESQVVSVVATFAVSIFLMYVDDLASSANSAFLSKIAQWISFNSRFNNFAQGIFNFSNAIFFLSVTAIFIFLTIRVVDSKRWN